MMRTKIGVYNTEQEANAAVERLKGKKGFVEDCVASRCIVTSSIKITGQRLHRRLRNQTGTLPERRLELSTVKRSYRSFEEAP